MRDVGARDPAAVDLFQLVAVDGVLQEEREVGKDVQGVVIGVDVALGHGAVVVAVQELAVEGLARCGEKVGWVFDAEAGQLAVLRRPQRNLVDGVTGGVIADERERHPVVVGLVADRVFEDADPAVEVFLEVKGAVVEIAFDGVEQVAGADLLGIGHEHALPVVHAGFDLGDAVGHLVEQVDRHRAGGGEVADVGVVRPLAEIDDADDLRDDGVQIEVALTVGVGGQVVGHVVHEAGEVGAVVEAEAAQEILVRLALAAVLRHDQAGHFFEEVGGPQNGPVFEVGLGDFAGGGGVGASGRVGRRGGSARHFGRRGRRFRRRLGRRGRRFGRRLGLGGARGADFGGGQRLRLLGQGRRGEGQEGRPHGRAAEKWNSRAGAPTGSPACHRTSP